MAAIVLTRERLLHLALLIALSTLGALALIQLFEFTTLAAFGASITVVCQVNAAVVSEKEKRRKAEELAAQKAEKREQGGSTKKRR